ncbi:MAG: Crp/Fnr family transcriptional regulator [Deltaproteobacteria bacterium]|nr:Crp/Fnr family transcriptional regulator [Deltaproteobacteria bacterium]
MSSRLYGALANHPVLGTLSEAALQQVCLSATARTYRARATVKREGDLAEHFCVLLEGRVQLYHSGEGGMRVAIRDLRAPAVFGEFELLSGSERSMHSVQALTYSTLLWVPKDSFLELVRREHAFSLAVLSDISRRHCIAVSNERVFALSRLRTRLASYLLTELERESIDMANLAIVEVTQTDLADLLGVSLRAIAKEVAALRRAGVLDWQRGGCRIRDLDALREYADGKALPTTHRSGEHPRVAVAGRR